MHSIRLFAAGFLLTSIAMYGQDRSAPNPVNVAAVRARIVEMQTQGVALLQQALADADQLGAENQVVLKTEALNVLWDADPQRARRLVAEIVPALKNLDAQPQDADLDGSEPQAHSYRVRQQLIDAVAAHDPRLALDLLIATRPANATDFQQHAESALEMTLASRAAAKDPATALRMAEKGVKSLSWDLMNVMSGLNNQNPEMAQKLAREVYAELQSRDLSRDPQALSFAMNWLNMTPAPQGAYQGPLPPGAQFMPKIADRLVSAAMRPGADSSLLSNLANAMSRIEEWAPGRTAGLKQKVSDTPQNEWTAVQQAAKSGVEAQLKVAAESRPEMRESLYAQIAMSMAGQGDYERARQIALEKISDPRQRAQVMLEFSRQAAQRAAVQGNLVLARALAEEVQSPLRRAQLLAELALSYARPGNAALAAEMANEAISLIPVPPQGPQFHDAISVLRTVAPLQPVRAAEVVGSVLQRVNEALTAAAELDGFVGGRSFNANGELVLIDGQMFYSLAQPICEIIAAIGEKEVERATSLADGLQRPEARAYARLRTAKQLLESARNQQNQGANCHCETYAGPRAIRVEGGGTFVF